MNYYLVDVFTNKQFGGNPLAVFPNADDLTNSQMQSIAGELNLSETTFIQKPQRTNSDCSVRIFTPKSELPMAGHPTIGTAWVILKYGLLRPQNTSHLVFDEGVGAIQVDYEIGGQEHPTNLVMYQRLPEFGETLNKSDMAELLTLEECDLSKSHPVQIVSCGVPIIIVPLNSRDVARRVCVQSNLMDRILSGVECREILVFTRETENSGAHVHCRFFAHELGIAEDPATGGAHGPLGSYLVEYGILDGSQIISEQGIEMGRPSTISVRIDSSRGNIVAVRVGGDCVEVGNGTLKLEALN